MGSSPLDSTYGFWLISIWLQTLLQGCGMLQVWLYFHWYENDRWGIKAMVYALLIIETFQSVMFFQITYFYLIDGFGNSPGLSLIHWQDSAQLFATYLSAFIVQMYFAYCIYIVENGKKITTALIVVLALTQIGAGMGQTITTARLTSFAQLDSTKAIATVESAAAFACDVMITIALVRNFGKNQGGVKSTNNFLDTVMINAINRGMMTSLCALLDLILFLAIPHTFYFFIGLMLSGKLYMNSALATLNSRSHNKKSHSEGDRTEISWNVNSTPMTTTDNEMGGDRSDEDYKGSRTFIDGMI